MKYFFIIPILIISLFSFNSTGIPTDSNTLSMKPQLMWNKTWGTTGFDGVNSIAMDDSGNIYTSGSTRISSIDQGLILKYDSDGNEIWNTTTNLGLGWRQDAIGNDGNLYVSMTNTTEMNIAVCNSTGKIIKSWSWLGGGSGLATSNDSVYVAGGIDDNTTLMKYQYNGSLIWNRNWDSGAYDLLDAIAISDDNNTIYCAGISGNKYGVSHVLIMAYSSDGIKLWNRTWVGGSYNDAATSIAVDSQNNLYVCGWTASIGAGNHDVMLLKYDSNGNFKWVKTWGGTLGDDGFGIAIHNNSVYITGETDQIAPGGYYEIPLLKYDFSGNLIWNTSYTFFSNGMGSGIAISKTGEIYITGSIGFSGTAKALLLKYIEVPDGAPEFITIILPTITLMAIFIAITKRKKVKEQMPRFPKAKP